MWYPNPFRSPVHQPVIDLARDAGLGDVIMCTPALRELKRVNPGSRIRFYTNFGDLVRGLPYIDEVRPYSEAPSDKIFIEYTHIMPSPTHIARLLGDRIGVNVKDVRPDCIVDRLLIDRFTSAWAGLPHPRVAVLRRASRFTPNKDWPNASWDEVVSSLTQSGSVIELGDKDFGDPPREQHETYVDLRGRTSLQELAAIMAAADIYVGPVSGPMHIAAAVNTPAVVVIGGFEHPVNAHYNGNIELFTHLPCSPCWLRKPCPLDLNCLKAISSEQVIRATGTIWSRLQSGSLPDSAKPAPLERKAVENLVQGVGHEQPQQP
jgi:ADP-heptose:LPS heptosyltransferase